MISDLNDNKPMLTKQSPIIIINKNIIDVRAKGESYWWFNCNSYTVQLENAPKGKMTTVKERLFHWACAHMKTIEQDRHIFNVNPYQ